MRAVDTEERRLLALHRYGLLDTPPEEIFDGITLALANICDVPICLVSLVDASRQWFKSSCGLAVRETPRDVAFCSHAILQPTELMVVEDAAADHRFRNNALVTADPFIRFYAGKPIVTEDGYPLGTLCVIDRKPRKLKPYQLEAVESLGNTVSAILQERYRLQNIALDRDSIEGALHETALRYQHLYKDAESMLRAVLQRLPAASVVIDSKGVIVSFNDAWTQFLASIGWDIIGRRYLDAYESAATSFGEHSHEVVKGIRAILSGEMNRFALSLSSPVGDFLLQAETLSDSGSGALIQHIFPAQK